MVILVALFTILIPAPAVRVTGDSADVPFPTTICPAGTFDNPVPPYQTGVMPVDVVEFVNEAVETVALPPSIVPPVTEANEEFAAIGTQLVPL